MYWYKGKHPWNISPFLFFLRVVVNRNDVWQTIQSFIKSFSTFCSLIKWCIQQTSLLPCFGDLPHWFFCLDDAKMFQHFSITFYDEQMFHEILFLVKIQFLKRFHVLYFHYKGQWWFMYCFRIYIEKLEVEFMNYPWISIPVFDTLVWQKNKIRNRFRSHTKIGECLRKVEKEVFSLIQVIPWTIIVCVLHKCT